MDLQPNSKNNEFVDESTEFHQSENEEKKYGSEVPVVREESFSTTNRLNKYLEPTLVKEESEEAPPIQPLIRIESNISAGGPQSWDMLGNNNFNF